ncbi:hypothetical protein CK222_27990 [Mesorhizobium sp. WSM3866]|nr:hypothetical protein CK222_27990 [Mesorhizobium sp. WSM3866]
MRITILRQFVQGLEDHDEQAGQDLLETLRRIKWHLWHHNVYLPVTNSLTSISKQASLANMRKFLTAVGGFQAYIAFQQCQPEKIRQELRSGDCVSASVVERAVLLDPPMELNVPRRSALCFWRKPSGQLGLDRGLG